MRQLPIILILLTLFFAPLSAESMYTLSGITKVYPVVEVSGKDVPKESKDLLSELLLEMTQELGIDTSGYDQRSLALLVNEMYVGTQRIINVKLLVGEQVRRLDQPQKTFGVTYISVEHLLYTKETDILEQIEDAADTLLEKFAEQYREENRKIATVTLTKADFAAALGYETDYESALRKGRKEHKDIMLVLVVNFCPWCRKFEQRVLMKKEVNRLVHQNYIPLIINKEAGGFPKELDKAFTPIVHFISYKTAKSYQNIIGYNNRDSFVYALKSHQKD